MTYSSSVSTAEPAPVQNGGPSWLRRSRPLLFRVGVFATVLGAAWLVAWRTGALASMSVERLRAAVAAAGPLGYLLYVAAFVVGELVYIPAILFIGIAAALWGKALAFGLAFTSGVLSATAGFYVGRAVSVGLSEPPPWLMKLEARLATHGIRTVTYLRILFWLAPWLNMGLGLTRVRFRDYIIGTALGVLPAVLLLTTVFHDVVAGGRSPTSVSFVLPIVGLLALFGFAFWRRRSLVGGGGPGPAA
jgi:MYXO-CTERM domain-containing protein